MQTRIVLILLLKILLLNNQVTALLGDWKRVEYKVNLEVLA